MLLVIEDEFYVCDNPTDLFEGETSLRLRRARTGTRRAARGRWRRRARRCASAAMHFWMTSGPPQAQSDAPPDLFRISLCAPCGALMPDRRRPSISYLNLSQVPEARPLICSLDLPRKRIMKNAFLLALLLAFGCLSTAQAQETAGASTTISAKVITALTITKNQDLNFGDVAQGQIKRVPIVSAKATKFTVLGEPSHNVTFTLMAPAHLTDASANTLPYTSFVNYNTVDDPNASSDLADKATVPFSSAGALYVYLGGEVAASAAQARGAYSGTFTVQVDY